MPILVVLLFTVPMSFGAGDECFERSFEVSGKQAVVVLKVDRAVFSEDAMLLQMADGSARLFGEGSIVRDATIRVLVDRKPAPKSATLICEMKVARVTAKGEDVLHLGGQALKDIASAVVPLTSEKSGRWNFSLTVDTKDFRDRESEALVGELNYRVTSLLVAKLLQKGDEEAVEVFRFRVTQALSGIELEPQGSTKVSCSR